MQLGDFIRRLQAESVADDALLSLGDVTLLARVAQMAAYFEESPGAYVAGGVGRFAAAANDEAWLRLISDVERADDPGPTALRRMVLWALETDADDVAATTGHARGCTCEGGSCHEAR